MVVLLLVAFIDANVVLMSCFMVGFFWFFARLLEEW